MTPEQLKASILQYAIQGKLVEQSLEEKRVDLSHIKLKKTEEFEFDIPDGWLTAHLESITKSVASKQYQIAASDFKTTGKYPVVSQSKEYIIGYSDDASKLYRHENPVVIFGDHTTEVKYVDLGNGTSREINASDIHNLPAGYIVVYEPGAGFENQAGNAQNISTS